MYMYSTNLKVFFVLGEVLELLGELEGVQDGVFTGQGDVGLAGQAAVRVQPVLGGPQLIKLALVHALLVTMKVILNCYVELRILESHGSMQNNADSHTFTWINIQTAKVIDN